MRRLDRAFDRLADRGRRFDPDVVIDRLERRLAGEPEVVALPGRTDVKTAPAPRRWRGPLIAAGALALALLVAVPILLLRNGGDAPSADDGTTVASTTIPATSTTATATEPSAPPATAGSTTTAATTTTAPPATSTEATTTTTTVPAWASGAGWARTGEGPEGYNGMLRVAWLDGLLVAFGYSDAVEGGAVWVSGDGGTWDGPTAVPWAPRDLEAVSNGGPGLVAVTTGDAGRGPEIGIWTSANGADWRSAAVLSPAGATGGEGGHLALGESGGGLVLAGVVCVPECENAVWVAPNPPDRDFDASVWERVPIEETGLGTDLGDGHPARQINTIVFAGADGYLAGGLEYDGESGTPYAAFFRSDDGRSWRVSGRIEGSPGSVSAIHATPAGGFLALVGSPGGYETGLLRVYTSPDGEAWSLVHEEATLSSGADLFFDDSAVVCSPGRSCPAGSGAWIAVVGTAHLQGDGKSGVVLMSPDGAAWALVGPDDPVFEDAEILSVTDVAGRLVAVGQICDSSGETCRAVTWAWSPPG